MARHAKFPQRPAFGCKSDDPLLVALTDAANARNVTADQLEAVSGVSRHSWREWRDGKASPTLRGLRSVATALGYDLVLEKRRK